MERRKLHLPLIAFFKSSDFCGREGFQITKGYLQPDQSQFLRHGCEKKKTKRGNTFLISELAALNTFQCQAVQRD